MTDPDAIALLRAVLDELRGIRLALETAAAAGARQSPSRPVTGVSRGRRGSGVFSCEVIAHARVDAALHAALGVAGLGNARKLGKFFRTIEGETHAGVRLERIGVDRDGVIWRVRVSRV